MNCLKCIVFLFSFRICQDLVSFCLGFWFFTLMWNRAKFLIFYKVFSYKFKYSHIFRISFDFIMTGCHWQWLTVTRSNLACTRLYWPHWYQLILKFNLPVLYSFISNIVIRIVFDRIRPINIERNSMKKNVCKHCPFWMFCLCRFYLNEIRNICELIDHF